MQIIAQDSIADLQRLAKRERDGRVRNRIQGVALVLRGQSAAEIGQTLGVSARSVRDWVKRYNEGGVAGLEEQPGRGRPSYLKEHQQAAFRARLEAGAQPRDGVCSLRGNDIRQILEEEFEVVYTLDGVYRLLHRMGYSSLVPRPRHMNANPERQQDFKKSASRDRGSGQ